MISVKKIFIFLCFFTLISCSTNNKKPKISFDEFVNEKNSKNSIVLSGNNGDIVNITIPDGFNWSPDNFGSSGNYLVYEMLEKNKTFKNFNKMISLNEILVPVYVNFNDIIKTYIKSSKNTKTCKLENSKIDIIEKNKKDAVLVMQCSEIEEGTIPDQSGKQGEITFIKMIFSKSDYLNKNFSILYSYRQNVFKLKDVNKIINSTDYKEFYNLTNQTLICDYSYNKKGYCKNIIKINPNNFSKIEYKIPEGYISNKKLIEQFKVNDFLIKNGETLEKTKKPAISIKYYNNIDNFNKFFNDLKASAKLSIKNASLEEINVNNLNLFQTRIDKFLVKTDEKNESPFVLFLLQLKNNTAAEIRIFVDKNKDLKSDFINDFIKNIRLK